MAVLLLLGLVGLVSTEVYNTAPPELSVIAADGSLFDATAVLRLFGDVNRSDPAGAAFLDGLLAPNGGAYSIQEKRSLLGGLDMMPTGDTGDVACRKAGPVFGLLFMLHVPSCPPALLPPPSRSLSGHIGAHQLTHGKVVTVLILPAPRPNTHTHSFGSPPHTQRDRSTPKPS